MYGFSNMIYSSQHITWELLKIVEWNFRVKNKQNKINTSIRKKAMYKKKLVVSLGNFDFVKFIFV